MWTCRTLLLVFLLKLNHGQEDPTYNLTDPLKVMIKFDENGVIMTTDTDESDSNGNGTEVFLCPKRSAQLPPSTSNPDSVENECLVKVDDSSPCFKEFKPKLQLESERCGSAKQGSLYSFKYDLCLVKKEATETKSEGNNLSIKLPSSDSLYDIESNASSSQPDLPIELRTLSVILYSVCYGDFEMETLYTTHRILTKKKIQVPFPNSETVIDKFRTDLPGGSQMNVKNFVETYTKLKGRMCSGDALLLRSLVPGDDIDPLLMRDSYLHFLNIEPIWFSKVWQWNKINKKIKKHVKDPRAEIYTSTSDAWTFDDTDWKFVTEKVFIRVALIQWKLITIPSDRGFLGFIVALHNVPLQWELEMLKAQYVCPKSICSDINFDIEEDYFIQCCPATKDILNRLGYQGGKEIIGDLKFEKN